MDSSDIGTYNVVCRDNFLTIISGISGKGVETRISDNLKEKTNKFIDKSVDTTREAAQTIHNDAKMKAPKISGEGKTGVHKAVSNAKIAVHGAGPA